MNQKKIFEKVGKQFLRQTEEFRNIPKDKRLQKLKQIFSASPSQHLFCKTFPQYPKQYIWNNGGMKLAGYKWHPENIKPKGLVINLNALNSHSGLSGEMAKQLAQQGYIVSSFDYPNFGKSDGTHRGHIQSMEELVQISQNFLQISAKQYKDIPIFVLGVSMGGLISFHLGLRHKKLIDGCIFINPAFVDNQANNPYMKQMIRLGGSFLPKMQTIKPMRSYSTKHSLEQYKLQDEFLYAGKLWTSTSANLLNYMRKTKSLFSNFDLPCLYLQGGTDKIIDPFTAFDFQQESSSEDKQIVVIKDLWHAVWFDDHIPSVIKLTQQWLNQRSEF